MLIFDVWLTRLDGFVGIFSFVMHIKLHIVNWRKEFFMKVKVSAAWRNIAKNAHSNQSAPLQDDKR